MADQHSPEGSSTGDMSSGSPGSTLELNLKTLDSHIYRFHADKNMPVSAFKEKIAVQVGVPLEQQRLIFRGKVLKDDHPLSEYQLENGDTLHLVVRQPLQPQSSSSSNTGEATTNSGERGQEPRNRVGQISHSVVLGTFNVGEQGEGTMPDLNRVIGAVLNSIGIGNQTGTQPSFQFNTQVPAPQRSEAEGTRNDAGIQNQAGNQPQPWQPSSGQSLPQVVQIPLGAAIAVPSLNMPIPDSLNTLSDFMNRMELAFAQHGYQPNQASHLGVNPPATELPLSSRGVPTPGALGIVLRHAQGLIGGPALEALSRVAGRIEQEAGSSDPTVRGQIQSESVQVGLAMQHLGSLLLELGRTILTLRMGQSPAESSVNAGPAVYISPSGPNPIMVQPFPLQTSSLFGSSTTNPLNPGTFGPAGVGNISRHVNIHIHTGASVTPFVSGVAARTTNGEAAQGEHVNGTGSGDSGQSRELPVRNIVSTAIPSGPAVIAVSGSMEPNIGVSQPPNSFPISTVVSEVSSQIQSFVDNLQNEHITSGQPESGSGTENEDKSSQPDISSSNGVGETNRPLPGICNMEDTSVNSKAGNVEGASSSSQGMDTPDGSSTVPLGLGLGGLQPKRRSRQSRSQGTNGDGASASSNQSEQPRIVGQQVLESLASLSTKRNANSQPPEQLSHSAGGLMDGLPAREQSSDGQSDVANAMSQVLQNPALNGLLTGVSQQTGIGSPNALRNMLEQLTQTPAMRTTVNQIAQQIDNNDLGSMFSGLSGGAGGGFDLSRMVQQMMPIVSQALSGVPTAGPPAPSLGSGVSGSGSRREVRLADENSLIDLQQVVQRIEGHSQPGEIFSSVVRNASHFYEGGSGQESVVNALSSEEGLVADFMEMLRDDISRRLEETDP